MCQRPFVTGRSTFTVVTTSNIDNFSALMTLYEHELKSGQSTFAVSAEQGLHNLAQEGMESLVSVVAEYSIKIQTTLPFNTNQVSPLVINCLYRMASWLSRSTAVASREDYLQALASIRQGLRKLDSRWKVAGKTQIGCQVVSIGTNFLVSGEYLKILDGPMSHSPMEEDSQSPEKPFPTLFSTGPGSA